jgi:Ca2+-transporting ATPase
LSVQEAMEKLKTGKSGLSESEALSRMEKRGANVLPEKDKSTYLGVALSQMESPIVYMLLIAAIISLLLGHWVDAGVILFAVFINTAVGFLQEVKAEEALSSLSRMVVHKTYVRRDGIEREIDSAGVVRGDILIIKAGDMIPADARLIESYELEVEEAALTGEAVPVQKVVKVLDQEGDSDSKKNMIYMGSKAIRGRALAVVTATGAETKFGRIAGMLETVIEEDTPLQDRLKRFRGAPHRTLPGDAFR